MVQLAYPIGSDARVDAANPGFPYQPQIAVLKSGNYVLVWSKPYTSGVGAQMFDASGRKVGAELTVGTTPSNQGPATVASTPDGGFAIMWGERSGYYLQSFDANGGRVGGIAGYGVQDFASTGNLPTIAAFPSGDLVFSYVENGDIKTWITQSNGIARSLFTTDTGGFDGGPKIEILTNNTFVLMWTGRTDARDPNGVGVVGQIFSSSGKTIGDRFTVRSDFSTSQSSQNITATADGGFVATWVQYGTASGIYAQMFDSLGHTVGNKIPVSTSSLYGKSAPDIASTSSGSILISWLDTTPNIDDASYPTITAQYFDGNGTRIGDEFRINSQTRSMEAAPVTAIIDGNHAISVWTATGGESGQINGVMQRSIILPVLGTNAADDLTANGQINSIAGRAGDDRLTGGLGADVLDGGPGTDTVIGGYGNDTLDGGLGNDSIDGGEGDDLIVGSLGVDTIDAGNGNDVVRFQTFEYFTDERPIAKASGGDGYDTLDLSLIPGNFGLVSDSPGIFYPGFYAGSQRYAIDGFERIIFGSRNDSINSRNDYGSNVDFYGGAGDDSFSGSGNIGFYGEAGNDTFFISGTFGSPTSGTINGGLGIDTILTNIGFSVDLTNRAVKSSQANYTVIDVENVTVSLSGYYSSVIGNGGENLFQVATYGNDGNVGVLFDGRGSNDTLRGSAGNDTLIGGAGADVLTGGAGADIFSGSVADMKGDRITDLAAGDRIHISNASYDALTFTRIGSTLRIFGSDIDIGTGNLRLIASRSNDGGTDLIAVNHTTALADFDGDGHSDILWRHDGGSFSTWSIAGNVAAITIRPNTSFVEGISAEKQIVAPLDFDGDARSDLILRDRGSGAFSIWTGKPGGWTADAYVNDSVSADWTIAATGDFNGDGKDDLLWRRTDGSYSTWQSTGTGFVANVVSGSVSTDWKVAGTGDFNGDGKADVVWRNGVSGVFTLWSSTGAAFAQNTYVDGSVATDWHIDAIGDFDGDGRDDLLWRNDGGAFSIWRSTGSGFAPNTYFNGSVSPDWQIAQVGDFNADGKADLLWRNQSAGAFTLWQSNGAGFDENIVFRTDVGPQWSVVAADVMA